MKSKFDFKPKDNYDGIQDLIDALPEDMVAMADKKKRLVMVALTEDECKEGDHWDDVSVLFKHDEDGSLTRVDTDKLIIELVKVLSPHLTPEKLIEDVLKDTDPSDLVEIYDRAIERSGVIKEKEGCYAMTVGGKRGAPLELSIRD